MARRAFVASVCLLSMLAIPSPAAAAALTNPSWAVSKTHPSDTAVRYTWQGTTATTQTLSKVTMTVPAQTIGRYLSLPGTDGNYASTPDSVANSITGDIDMRIKVRADDWTPATPENLINKRSGGDSFTFRIETSGRLNFFFWDAGGTQMPGVTYLPSPAFTDGATTKWFRVTLDVDNGASQYVPTIYESDDGASWTQKNSVARAGGPTSIRDTGAPIHIGAFGNTNEDFGGNVYYAEIRNGIGGAVVVKMDPGEAASNAATSWTSSTAEVWTVNQSGGTPAALGGLAVGSVYGVPSGGTATMSGTTVTYSFTPTSVPANTPFMVALDGFTSTYVAGSYTSAITTYDNAGTPAIVDGPTTTPSITFDGNTLAASLGVARTMSFTNDTTSITLLLDPGGTGEATKTAALSVATSAGNGYTLYASAPSFGVAPELKEVNDPTGGTATCDGGTFPANRWGYSVGVTTQGGAAATAIRQGNLASGHYCGHASSATSIVAQSAATNGDVFSVVTKGKVNFLQAANTYTTTVTYSATPSY